MQVIHALIHEIQRGRLLPGAALPSSRELAATLGVNRKTVVLAYEDLIAQGWLTALGTRGTIVSTSLPEVGARRAEARLAETSPGAAVAEYPYKYCRAGPDDDRQVAEARRGLARWPVVSRRSAGAGLPHGDAAGLARESPAVRRSSRLAPAARGDRVDAALSAWRHGRSRQHLHHARQPDGRVHGGTSAGAPGRYGAGGGTDLSAGSRRVQGMRSDDPSRSGWTGKA